VTPKCGVSPQNNACAGRPPMDKSSDTTCQLLGSLSAQSPAVGEEIGRRARLAIDPGIDKLVVKRQHHRDSGSRLGSGRIVIEHSDPQTGLGREVVSRRPNYPRQGSSSPSGPALLDFQWPVLTSTAFIGTENRGRWRRRLLDPTCMTAYHCPG